VPDRKDAKPAPEKNGGIFFSAPTSGGFAGQAVFGLKNEEKKSEESEASVDYEDPDEAGKAAISGLADAPVKKGTEDEVCLFKERAKIFRFRNGQWKERGVGNAKLLRNDKTKVIRFVMRQEQTLKPCGNFIITEMPSCTLNKMGTGDKSYNWACMDFSDPEKPEGGLEQLAVRFMQVEQATNFKQLFEASQQFNTDAKTDKELIWASTVEDQEEIL
jgi:hypothetical protein